MKSFTDFLVNNWTLILLVITSGGMLLLPSFLKSTAAGILPSEAVNLMNRHKAVLIDVRDADERSRKDHIASARSVPMADLAEQLPKLVKDKAAPVLFVCGSGNRAKTALKQAKDMGYTAANIIAGGTKGWADAGLPINKGNVIAAA